MKIGIDIRLIGKNQTGSEVFIFNIVKNLALIDDKNDYVLYTDYQDQDTLNKISNQLGIVDKANFKIVALALNRYEWNFWGLAKYLRKNPVDIYHTQYITPWFVSRKIKIVTIVHDISFNFFPQFIKLKDLFFLKTLIPISLNRADKIIGVSQFTKGEIISYYKIDPMKVECIYNSISDEFKQQNFTKEELGTVRRKYNLPEKFILYMGTLQPRKNIAHLIEAYARITNKIDNFKLVICGNRSAHNYDHQIDKALETYPIAGQVLFPGFIDEEDKAKIFQLAYVFVFPSLYEGFGIPVLEAMSQGTPVLCSNIESFREIADKSALFFEVNSSEDFSDKLCDICLNEKIRSELIQQGKERIKVFSWKKSASKLLAIYESLGHN